MLAKSVKQGDGTYPAYAWPGGYSIYYIDSENQVLCPDCANKEDEHTNSVEYCEIHWEGPDLICDDCGKVIESAYGDD